MSDTKQTSEEHEEPTDLLAEQPPQPKKIVRIGRPAKYKTPEELTKKIEEYFNHGIPTIDVVVGKGHNQHVIQRPVPTISGLSNFLGFCDRQSMFAYKAKTQFSCIIKKATQMIAQHYEEQLQAGVVVGSIFWLKCHGWRDQAPVDEGVADTLSALFDSIRSRSTVLPIIEAVPELTSTPIIDPLKAESDSKVSFGGQVLTENKTEDERAE